MITTELIFIRHGQAQCNLDGLVGGPATCTGLTNLGRAQMTAAASRLAAEHQNNPFTALYAGPRRRLIDSGTILARSLGLDLTVDPGLDGPIHGDADGRPWHDVKTAANGPPHAHPDKPWAPGSDTWNGYLHRAGTHLATLIRQHPDGRLLFAAHGETIWAAHALLLAIPPGTEAGFTFDHGSLTRWQHHRNRLGQNRWMLDRHNDTAHLNNVTDPAS